MVFDLPAHGGTVLRTHPGAERRGQPHRPALGAGRGAAQGGQPCRAAGPAGQNRQAGRRRPDAAPRRVAVPGAAQRRPAQAQDPRRRRGPRARRTCRGPGQTCRPCWARCWWKRRPRTAGRRAASSSAAASAMPSGSTRRRSAAGSPTATAASTTAASRALPAFLRVREDMPRRAALRRARSRRALFLHAVGVVVHLPSASTSSTRPWMSVSKPGHWALNSRENFR